MKAIPTTVNGLRFRSRLEATWACFFDNCGWKWEYEPFDLDGYIPDFVLKLHRPVIVEVKPCCDISEMWQHTEKISNSGWDGEAVIVGIGIFQNDFGRSSLGLIQETNLGWSESDFGVCSKCGRNSFVSSTGSFHCRANDCYCGGGGIIDDDPSEALRLWNSSKTKTQWNRRRRCRNAS